jgi:hypothetical protein
MTDHKFCPQSLRAVVTEYLQFGVKKWKMDSAMVSLLRRALEHAGNFQVVDLCSGSGGPWPNLLPRLERDGIPVSVCLTDKYPNAQAFLYARDIFGGSLNFSSEPVDAVHVPESLAGLRTIFSAFHHFSLSDARAILQNAVTHRQGIAIFEVTQRTPWAVFIFFLTSLLMPFCVPFFRPFRWSSLMWTYLIPASPAVTLFDSLMSCLRTYSVEELRKMTTSIDGDGYSWDAGEIKVPHAPVPITYLLGYPDNLVQ